MRVLFITAFYPPAVIGGWEQLVQEINEHLLSRGHETQVLTTSYGLGSVQITESGVERVLELESDVVHYQPVQSLLNKKRRLRRNLYHTEAVITRFNPDVVFVHVMWNLSRAIPWSAERLRPGRVVYYVANDWPYAPDTHEEYWQQPARRTFHKFLKRLLANPALWLHKRESRAFPLQFGHVMCVSKAIRNNLLSYAGIPPESLCVVYNGIDCERFAAARPSSRDNAGQRGLTLVYAGSVVPHKGVHTTIEAMALLSQEAKTGSISLTIVGSGHPDYEASLRQLAARHGLGERVRFEGRITREEMPDLLGRFDVLVFPSIWQEPLARMVQEAMAAGLVVIGTTTGGTGEILVEGETGLTFEAGDAQSLARQIERLSQDPDLRSKLVLGAQDRVKRDFDINRMIDEIELYLARVADHGAARLSGSD